jgi:hypothetical protein
VGDVAKGINVFLQIKPNVRKPAGATARNGMVKRTNGCANPTLILIIPGEQGQRIVQEQEEVAFFVTVPVLLRNTLSFTGA